MLEIVNYNSDKYEFPCLLVLGCFDGLHIGHSELLKKAKLQAKINGLDLGVMMFTEGKGGKQVYTFEERLKLLEQYNVKFVLKIDFNDEFKKTKPLDFLQVLEEELNVKAYMSGKDFRFGAGAKGKSSTLKNYCDDEENGVWYMSVKDVTADSEKVSTTFIKSLLENGDIARANQLLARNYSVTGTVTDGADRGGKLLGIPTMNILYPENKAEIKRGVYGVKCNVCGVEYCGVANYGARPTFGESEDLLEVHLVGYNGNCRGETVTVEFVNYIRDICKFDSADALKAQILADLGTLNAENGGTSVEELPNNGNADTTVLEVSSSAEAEIKGNAISVAAVEELAVADENENTQSAGESEEVPVANEESADKELTEDVEFEEELNEEYEATSETENVSSTQVETAGEPEPTAENEVEVNTEDNQCGNDTDEAFNDMPENQETVDSNGIESEYVNENTETTEEPQNDSSDGADDSNGEADTAVNDSGENI